LRDGSGHQKDERPFPAHGNHRPRETTGGARAVGGTPYGGGIRLRLTPNSTGQAGSAFLSQPITFHAGNTFSYQFQFKMT